MCAMYCTCVLIGGRSELHSITGSLRDAETHVKDLDQVGMSSNGVTLKPI